MIHYRRRRSPLASRGTEGGAAVEDRLHRRGSGRSLLRRSHEEGGPRARHHRRGAEPPRRHLRLRRRLLGRDPRALRPGRSRDPRRDRPRLRPLGRHRHPLARQRRDLDGPRLLRALPPPPPRHPAAAVREPRGGAPVRDRGAGPRALSRRGPDPRRRRREQRHPSPPRRALRPPHRMAPEPVRVARHDLPVPGLHLHLQGGRARAVAGSRLPLRRAERHLHPGDHGRDLAASGARRGVGGRHGGVHRGALRRRAQGAPDPQEPVALAELPGGPERALVVRQRGPARRRRSHRALLGRLGDEARDGGRHRAEPRARAPPGDPGGARGLRGGAAARGREPPARGPGEPRVVRDHGALPSPRARPVRHEPPHPEPPRHAREPQGPGSPVRRHGGPVVRREGRRSRAARRCRPRPRAFRRRCSRRSACGT